ncbi:MAG: ABC transporter ATP-binding protein [Syntrophobacterales bacterium]|jgi:branched-chain amino acid transport system ATP-binding protein|nr:ABC transporter ATP-binding protein [Syntrophobacterales bacterium]
MLTLKSVQAGYGRLPVLKGISFHVREGEVVTLIGGNGAGKTTTLRAISGLLPPRQGAIEFAGRDLTRMAPERIVTLGLALVPEGRRVFRTLSVTANLELGAYHRRDKAEVRRDLEEIRERFPILKERAHQAAGTLSGGEQQILAIGRALMARPRLLMLDEPSMGLAPRMVTQVYEILAELKAAGTTLLLVEQNARAALKVADRGYVLETGRIILDGPAADLKEDPEVQRAYLGKGYREVWE